MIELERHYRVFADVVVGVWALPDVDDDDDEQGSAPHPWQREAYATARANLAAQDRLLRALVRDPCALDAWLKREAVRHVLDGGLDAFRIETREETLLRPVIASLPPPDREFFEEAIELDVFCEWADPFLNAVSAKTLGVSVSERRHTVVKSKHALAIEEYRVSIDLIVELSEIDDLESARAWLQLHEHCGCEPEVTADRFTHLQSSLLSTLRSCNEDLDIWLKQEVFRELVDYGDEPIVSELGDEEILGPVIAGLAPADRAHFEPLLHDGALYDFARAFYRAVGASTREVSIAELPMRFAARWR